MELRNIILKKGESYPLAIMDFSNIPKQGSRFKWEQAAGLRIPFKWLDIEGLLTFIEYKSSTRFVIEYNGRTLEFANTDFMKGKIWRFFVNSGTKYLYEIGLVVRTKGDSKLIILDRYKKNNNKYYKVECLDCHFQSERLEKDMLKSACGNCYYERTATSKYLIGDTIHIKIYDYEILDVVISHQEGHKYVEYKLLRLLDGEVITLNERLLKDKLKERKQNQHIYIQEGELVNSIYKVHPEFLVYFENPEEAKYIPCGSLRKVKFKCPHCGKYVYKSPHKLCRDGYIGCSCELRGSVAENIISNILDQFNVHYIPQASTGTLPWIQNRRRYDFYLPEYSMIIEAHGIQHYLNDRRLLFAPVEYQQLNDRYKRLLALDNGILHYFEIDCRNTSDLSFILRNLKEVFTILNIKEEDVLRQYLKLKISHVDAVNKLLEYIDNNPDCTKLDILTQFGFTRHYYLKYMRQLTRKPEWFKERRETCQN